MQRSRLRLYLGRLCEYLGVKRGRLGALELAEDTPQGWHAPTQALLARVWDHPDENLYTLSDGKPM